MSETTFQPVRDAYLAWQRTQPQLFLELEPLEERGERILRSAPGLTGSVLPRSSSGTGEEGGRSSLPASAPSPDNGGS